MKIKWGIFATIALLLVGCATNDINGVSNFDVVKYSGTWYEIARKPNKFEDGLDNISAHYELLPNGSIKVTNTGWKSEPERIKSSVEGVAKITNSANIGELKVSFFWPFYGDYKVIDIDEDYTLALVCSGNMDYLWILSRTPTINESKLKQMLQIAANFKFDVSDIIVVDQSENLKTYNAIFNIEIEEQIEK